MNDTDSTILKEFADSMRPIRTLGLQVMAATKARLISNGISDKVASDLLHMALKALSKEANYEELK